MRLRVDFNYNNGRDFKSLTFIFVEKRIKSAAISHVDMHAHTSLRVIIKKQKKKFAYLKHKRSIS